MTSFNASLNETTKYDSPINALTTTIKNFNNARAEGVVATDKEIEKVAKLIKQRKNLVAAREVETRLAREIAQLESDTLVALQTATPLQTKRIQTESRISKLLIERAVVSEQLRVRNAQIADGSLKMSDTVQKTNDRMEKQIEFLGIQADLLREQLDLTFQIAKAGRDAFESNLAGAISSLLKAEEIVLKMQ